jgi:acetyl esterase/lipase
VATRTSTSIRRAALGLLAVLAVLASTSCRLIANPAASDLVQSRAVNGARVERDVLYGTDRGCFIITDLFCGGSQELDVFTSPDPGTGPRPVLLWLHGGGWSSGDKTDPLPPNVLGQLARGFDVLVVNHRLSPKHPYPAAVLDVKLAVRWVRSQAAARGWDPGRIMVGGHSSGGHLAVMAAVTTGVPGLEPVVTGPLAGVDGRVAGAVAVNGVLDLGASARSDATTALMVYGLLGCLNCDLVDTASPGWWMDRSDPPLYLVAGRNDPIAPTSQAVNLCVAATLVGSPCSLDLVDTGPPNGFGHDSGPSLNQTALDAFLDDPVR